MKKVFISLSLVAFLGSASIAVSSMVKNNSDITVKCDDEKDKKKKKCCKKDADKKACCKKSEKSCSKDAKKACEKKASEEKSE